MVHSTPSARSARSVHALALALALAGALGLLSALGPGCAKPAGDSAPAPDSAADVLAPPPQLAAVDAALMSGTWHWVGTLRPAGQVAPADPSRYTIEFLADSTVAVVLDCNGGGGRYRLIEGQKLEIGPIEQTLIGCPEPAMSFESEGAAVLRSNVRVERPDGRRMRLVSEAGSIDLELAI